MTKKDFVESYSKLVGENKKRTEELVNGFLETIENGLTKDGVVQFIGFGTFDVRKTAARKGRNPKTGESLKIPAKKVAKFKAGKKLATKVNKK